MHRFGEEEAGAGPSAAKKPRMAALLPPRATIFRPPAPPPAAAPPPSYTASIMPSVFVPSAPPPAAAPRPLPRASASALNPHDLPLRTGGGKVWVDPTLADWPANDFRLYVSDLGNEVSDEGLAAPFRAYPSFAMARVVKDKRSMKSKGFGFVSFLDARDALQAMKDVHGTYVGNRVVSIKRASWTEKNVDVVRRREREKEAKAIR